MFDLQAAWRLHPQVALRPELVRCVALSLRHQEAVVPEGPDRGGYRPVVPEHPTARDALHAASVDDTGRYAKALSVLADSQMLVRS